MSIYAIIGFISCFGAFFLLESILERLQTRSRHRRMTQRP